MTAPDYAGGSLVNLVAELEARLGGDPVAPPLHDDLAAAIPDAEAYVLVLFDGLGSGQLDHPAAAPLRRDLAAEMDAPFPTTTTVALASVATGMPPSQHGLVGYQLWMPEVGQVVNTIKWTTLWGDPVPYDTASLLPTPNLWERLATAGVEPITVQPYNFEASPLSRALYRGARFEPVGTTWEYAEATTDLATPGRLIFVYVPHVDFAAHVSGQDSEEYAAAMTTAAIVWEAIATGLPAHAVAIGTADHGHVDFPAERRIRIDKADHADNVFYGDGRAMYVRGDGPGLATRLPATWVAYEDMAPWWGPGPPHGEIPGRAPDGALLADDGWFLMHRHSDKRLIGNHGGLTEAEIRTPLLVSRG
jgi:hypothetical protein